MPLSAVPPDGPVYFMVNVALHSLPPTFITWPSQLYEHLPELRTGVTLTATPTPIIPKQGRVATKPAPFAIGVVKSETLTCYVVVASIYSFLIVNIIIDYWFHWWIITVCRQNDMFHPKFDYIIHTVPSGGRFRPFFAGRHGCYFCYEMIILFMWRFFLVWMILN